MLSRRLLREIYVPLPSCRWQGFVDYYKNSTVKVKLFSRLIRHHNFKGVEAVITPYILEEARGIRRL